MRIRRPGAIDIPYLPTMTDDMATAEAPLGRTGRDAVPGAFSETGTTAKRRLLLPARRLLLLARGLYEIEAEARDEGWD